MGEIPYSNEKCYELTLTPDYVSDWTFNDAIRELIQNGIDQEVLDKENYFSVEYDQARQILKLKNTRSVLKINTLLLGRSSKARNEDTVGQFGEGYKIAALVLNRLGKTFTVLNNEKKEIWVSRFKNSEKWREKILAFYIGKRETEDAGLCIEVGNVSWEEYAGLSKVWIGLCGFDYEKVSTQYGEILTDENLAGQVFVNGLFVDCNSDLQYGYNFKPRYINLERDNMIDSTTMFSPGDVMVIGDSAPIPLKIHVELAKERPQSRTIDFWDVWSRSERVLDYSEMVNEYLND